ncbi:MAG: PilN domain-containing protein [Actinoplanes sp.]
MAETALMPVDPVVSPQHINRVLAIRANLLPAEIKAGRNARHTRYTLIGVVVVVVLLLVGWYLYAVRQVTAAQDNLDAMTDQITVAQISKKPYGELTGIINETKSVDGQLTKFLTNDLPWATRLDQIRATGVTAGVTVESVVGALATDQSAALGGSAATTVATLSIAGTAPDKNTIAKYVELLAATAGLANPYLTTATQDDDGVSFTLSASITSKALCGRFSATKCTTGGN